MIIFIVAAVLSVGILTLAAPDGLRPGRLPADRRFGMHALREALVRAAAAAGKRAGGFRTAKKREQARKEIYAALSVLRNHASADAAGSGAAVTTDFILEQFARGDGVLKDAYGGALRFLRTGRKTEAAEYFASAADTELARDFIQLVLDWDAVPPHKLKKTVTAFQNALKETRTTELLRKNEVLSDLVYLPVIAGVLVIFVNFIFVAYFAEQRELLAELFF
jgi:hypothetical protein